MKNIEQLYILKYENYKFIKLLFIKEHPSYFYANFRCVKIYTVYERKKMHCCYIKKTNKEPDIVLQYVRDIANIDYKMSINVF